MTAQICVQISVVSGAVPPKGILGTLVRPKALVAAYPWISHFEPHNLP